MRRLIQEICTAVAIIIAGPIASGGSHIEGFGE